VKGDAVKRIATFLAGALTALLLGGCAGQQTAALKQQSAGVSISPSTATVRGGATQVFTSKSSEALAWAVNGITGGNPTVGTISASGQYTAPEFPPTPNSVSIAATELSDPAKTATAMATVQNPLPQITSLTPSSIAIGAFTVTVNGAHLAVGATALMNGTALTTTRVSSTQLTATGTAAKNQEGTVTFAVKNPDPGGAGSSSLSAQITSTPAIVVQISPTSVTLHAGDRQRFNATVTGTSNTGVIWSVDNQGGGSAGIGYATSQGDYLSPGSIPNPNTITFTATSVADPTKSSSATITLVNSTPTVTVVNPANIGVGPFTITVTGTGFVSGSVINFGGQALTTHVVSSTELTASGSATSAQIGSVPVSVTNPNPGGSTSGMLNAQVISGGNVVSAVAAVRFIEQSTFGPTPELVNQVQATGFDTFLQSQFTAPASTYPTPGSMDSGVGNVQTAFFLHAVNGPDQLRQRVAFALNELWVVSANKVSDPTGYTSYMSALTKDALGNYYDVMKDITLTPAMGHYLDMVNNDKPGTGQHANENYAREFMQLFTLGLNQLNPDGTAVLDGSGQPIPTYTQDDVMALGRSFTGWTFPLMPGATTTKHNPEYYGGQMVVGSEANHDNGLPQKVLLGTTVPQGQSAEQELDTVLTTVFNHPNLPPFVATQLIERLVTSNPSPGYVQRVAAAFSSGKYNSYGSGKRGDMRATLAAVLFDQEARRGDAPSTTVANDGKLREPVVMEVSIARVFHAATDGTGFTGNASNMSENLFNSGSVFNFFPPQFLIPQTTLNGPEFAIFDTNTSLTRVNFVNSIVYGQISSNTKLDFTPVVNAGTPDQMVAWLNTQFLHGTLSDTAKQSILTAVNAVSATDLKTQAKTAIYVVLSSSQYQVQR
jgi:uncharacterized protein (DUF1800 family)